MPPGDESPSLSRRPLDPRRVAAIVPCHRLAPDRHLIEGIRAQVGEVLVVDDGCPGPEAAAVDALVAEAGVRLLRLPATTGKGYAVAAGIRRLMGQDPPPKAVMVLDADGQHPPAAIPAFLASAAEAELVIGDRLADPRGMPWPRRLANRLASRLLSMATGMPVRDSQCGMRLLRGRALVEVEVPGGRYQSETVHLKRCLRAGVRVAWVPIPALYAGQRSSFRPLRDGASVLVAALVPVDGLSAAGRPSSASRRPPVSGRIGRHGGEHEGSQRRQGRRRRWARLKSSLPVGSGARSPRLPRPPLRRRGDRQPGERTGRPSGPPPAGGVAPAPSGAALRPRPPGAVRPPVAAGAARGLPPSVTRPGELRRRKR